MKVKVIINRFITLTSVLTLISIILVGLVFAQENKEPIKSVSEAKDVEAKDSYIIGASDVIEIQVWKEPDLSRTMTVRTDGKISLPLIDENTAAGLTALELKELIEEKYKAYVQDPVVSVIVVEPLSSKFYVVGEVNRPGEYPLNKRTTVLQALSTAGGFAEWAKRDKIVVVRKSDEGDAKIKVNYDKIVSGKDFSQNIVLEPGDTIIVP